MFADGNRQLFERIEALSFPRDPRVAVKTYMRTFLDFALEDPARRELLFDRHIPGFTPSPESYALAEEILGRAAKLLNDADVTSQGDIDYIVTMVAGLMAAKLSNDPGGTRSPVHPPPQPSRRPVPRRCHHKEQTQMNTNRIKRLEARTLAEEEFARFAATVASLTPEEWATDTDCTGWDVRKMALHVLGSGDA